MYKSVLCQLAAVGMPYIVRVDDDLKAKSDALFKDLGTDTTTAIRMF